MSAIRVVLADDHPVVRSGIRTLLDGADDIQVVGEASDGAEALQLVEELEPDILLLDMELPVVSGVDVARKLAKTERWVGVLALSAHDDEHYIIETLGAGVSGYLTKDEAPEQIVEAVRGVARGENGWLSRRVTAKIVSRVRPTARGLGLVRRLSERELEVLSLMARGLDNEEIAEELVISHGTVKNHVTSIYGKIGVRSRPKAIAWAREHGVGRTRADRP